ncbi:MAG: 6-phosphogluconolactonase [Candidatus Paceibacterota bacterium]
MSFTIKTTTEMDDAANFIVASILSQLKIGKHVLFFVSGGSSIFVAVKVAEFIKNQSLENLTITLTDERYGQIDHFNSNYFQLKEKGFNLPQAKIIPILTDNDRNITTIKFNKILNEEFTTADYSIGLFGIGVDGHTAGILPGSEAIQSKDLVYSYNTPIFSRITITPKAIEKLNEAVVWAQGKEKWIVLKNLEKEIDINLEPAQILKKVPLLTIFSDYKNI